MKVLKKTEVVRLKQVEHTLSERAILGRVSHPNVVNLLGTFQDAQNLYMIMEYVSGGELFYVPPSISGWYIILAKSVLLESLSNRHA